MKTRILESVKWDVNDEDVRKSKEAKKHLTDKLREWPVIDAKKHELREEMWKIKGVLDKATFFDEKEEMNRLRGEMSKARHDIGDLEAVYNREISVLRDEVYKTNSSVRKTLIEVLDRTYHGKELKPEWDLKSVQPYWKDTKSEGIITVHRYLIKTNQDAVQKAKEEIMAFIKEAGGVASPASRDHWIASLDRGMLRELSISEILTEVEKFEKKLNGIDTESLVEKEIGQGELDGLKRQEAA